MTEPATETPPNIPEGYVVGEDGCLCPAPKKKPPCDVEMKSCPYDPRYPNQNTTGRCYYSFIDYQRCVRLLGEYPGCNYFLKCYRSLCPIAWQERWFDQMERGIFPYKIYPPGPIIYPEKGRTCFEEEEEPAAPPDPCP